MAVVLLQDNPHFIILGRLGGPDGKQDRPGQASPGQGKANEARGLWISIHSRLFGCKGQISGRHAAPQLVPMHVDPSSIPTVFYWKKKNK